ncbi:MAG: hypothetical protein Q4C48_09050 [Lachnospiraceae bacterium]|nr:hypothetical protein [Lachnospiraceae bacterium]
MAEIDAANSIVWYYGNLDPGREITINYKKVKEFTEETIGDKENQYEYHAIVILDFDGKMDVSDEELLLIKDYCENRQYDLLYYGTEHMEQFRNNGFFTQMGSEEHGFTYNGSYWKNRSGQEQYLNPYLLTGNWTSDETQNFDTEDKHIVWKIVIGFMVDLVHDSNEYSFGDDSGKTVFKIHGY